MSVHHSFARRGVWLLLGFLLVVAPAGAAESGKITLYETKEIFWKPARSLASSFEMLPLPAQGPPQHGFLIDGSASSTLGDSVALIKQGYDAGLPLVIVAPAADAQGFVDDITGGDVDLPAGLTRSATLREPRLEAIGLRRAPGAATADISEFWVTFDDDDDSPADEKAEDDKLIAQIADWVSDKPAASPAPAKPTAPKAARPRMALKAEGKPESRASIDDLTSAIVRKVAFSFDQGSVATVVRSWAAYSASQNEDWYIFELTTTSQPLNFATYSLAGMFSEWEKGDANCRGILKTGCKRLRYASKVEVKLVPKTPGLELVYYGPDSDREQDEYSYSSKFSLGGKVTAGYDDKGPKAGVELSGGAEFSRSSKVTIKDATLVGISNPATEVAGWRFDMPQMRAVNDLTQHGGPSMSCDNLLQMPYPIQKGAMESRQFAIYRLPAAQRDRLDGINIAVSLSLEESSSRLQNWTTAYCNVFNCNCSPESWVHKNNELKDKIISFPLAAHPAK
ncbi:MAG: hypothetical protein JWO97_2909 [Acidobacteria bacterium]|nr:hypothetical protein [Acidobacteriota bacterium]